MCVGGEEGNDGGRCMILEAKLNNPLAKKNILVSEPQQCMCRCGCVSMHKEGKLLWLVYL